MRLAKRWAAAGKRRAGSRRVKEREERVDERAAARRTSRPLMFALMTCLLDNGMPASAGNVRTVERGSREQEPGKPIPVLSRSVRRLSSRRQGNPVLSGLPDSL